MKNVVTIGGGNGHSHVLKALKNFSGIKITAICPSTDSGGSTGVLVQEYDGRGYIGDLTKCIVALCNNEVLARSLSFRYERGPLNDHSVKNLLFHALEKTAGHQVALDAMAKLCGLGNHRVIPVTEKKTELRALLKMGNTISGETNIDNIAKNPLWLPNIHLIHDVYLKPDVPASEDSVKAIKSADYIVICPGDLYSSIIPTLLPRGMKRTIAKSKARVVILLNIMTKIGETDGYTAEDFVRVIEERLGRDASIIISNNAHIPKRILVKYSLESKVELSGFDDPRLFSAPLAMVGSNDQIYSNPKEIQKVLKKIFSVPR